MFFLAIYWSLSSRTKNLRLDQVRWPSALGSSSQQHKLEGGQNSKHIMLILLRVFASFPVLCNFLRSSSIFVLCSSQWICQGAFKSMWNPATNGFLEQGNAQLNAQWQSADLVLLAPAIYCHLDLACFSKTSHGNSLTHPREWQAEFTSLPLFNLVDISICSRKIL